MTTLALGLVAVEVCSGNAASAGDEMVIIVSPKTLVLRAPIGGVTVHTNIPWVTVDCSTLDLNGLAPTSSSSDDCGDLVAKFDADAVKAIVAPGEATLTLSGVADGVAFAVSDTITVKE